jgi:hypothetical protein
MRRMNCRMSSNPEGMMAPRYDLMGTTTHDDASQIICRDAGISVRQAQRQKR